MASAGASSAAVAFDGLAPAYDREFGRNPAGLLFRHVFQERLRLLFPPGARVLDLGCGTGEDALFLASLGVRVHALDISPAMAERTREKAERASLADRIQVEARPAEDVGSVGGGFDGAYSDFGALNCAALGAVGDGLARALRPGARVLVSAIGRWPLPALVAGWLGMAGVPRAESPRVASHPVPTRSLGPRELREALGPAFQWRDGFALGVLVPGPPQEAWIARHALAFGALAAIEGVVRAWPGLRNLGDHVVVEGSRR
jgi:ubiquinone/menaquinone biosynthesis C-methylase UbiE